MTQSDHTRQLNLRALFSDESEFFHSPMEPSPGDMVTIRFRTAANDADSVCLLYGEASVPMQKTAAQDGFDYYEAALRAGSETIRYVFQIRSGETVCYYDKLGVSREDTGLTPFRVIPGFSTPAWVKGTVAYQIFVDRFANGDPSNDVEEGEYSYIGEHVHRIRDWYQVPQAMDVRNFYGGDLQGVLDHLDYLQKLGIEMIYFNPIFVSPSNHKYDTQDYDAVDPHLGRIVRDAPGRLPWGDQDNSHAEKYIRRVTNPDNLGASNELLARLIREAHKRGIRVILDGVFNHCGSFNKWMDSDRVYQAGGYEEPGAFLAEDSPYHSYFRFAEDASWPDDVRYEGWWGHDTLPKLQYEASPALEEEILRIARKWVSPPYSADGWRLDVAADLGGSPEYNHIFWKKFRAAVKEANPEAIIFAEHYGSAEEWLQGDEWDTVMNYDAFMEPVSWFMTGMEKHSDAFSEEAYGDGAHFEFTMLRAMTAFSMPSLLTAMNQLDNHDHSRFLTRTNHMVGRVGTLGSEAASQGISKAVFRAAAVIQMTWPGVPTLYYGDEAGVCGFTDPDNRRTYPWGREDWNLIVFHQKLIAVRRRHDVLRTGSTAILQARRHLIGYCRFDRNEQVIVAVNSSTEEMETELDLTPAGISGNVRLTRVFSTDCHGFSDETGTVSCFDGVLCLSLPPESALVFTRSCAGDRFGLTPP